MSARAPIPRSLRVFWFVHGATLGTFFPFFSVYLHENAGLSAREVGFVSAVLPLVGIAAQPLWGRVADRSGSRASVLAAISAGSALGFVALYSVTGFAAIIVATGFLALFSSALVAMAVAVTLAALGGERADAFGRARVFGTLGFFAAVTLFPPALHAYQHALPRAAEPGIREPALAAIFPLSALLSVLSAASAYAIPRGGDEALRAERGDWRELWTVRGFALLLGTTLLGYFLTAGLNALFPLLVAARGGGIDTVSHLWVAMLSIEIPLVLYSGATLRRLGPHGLVALGIFAAGARWTLTGFFEDARIVYPAQVLHGVSVAGLVVGSSLWVDALVPAKLRSSAQGLLGMIGVSLAGFASNAAAGFAFDALSPTAPYCIAGVCGIALAVCILLMPPAHAPVEEVE